MRLKEATYRFLRWSEQYTKTDMVYLVRGSFWTYASFIVTNLFAFGLSIAFAHFLPKEIYGTYQFILSIGAILTAFTLTGMNNAVIQAVARGHEGALRKSLPTQLTYNLISFATAIGVAVYYFMQGNTEIGLGVILIGFLIPIFQAFNTYTAYISGKKDFQEGFIVGVISTVAYNIVMFVSLYFVKDPVWLVTINFAINAIVAIALYAKTLRKYHPNDSVDPTTNNYGKHLSLAGIVSVVAGQIDNLLVFHYLGTVQLAIYAFASTIPERLSSVIKNISLMAFPKLSARSDSEIKDSILGKSLRLGGLSAIIAILYIVVAPIVFGLFFPKYLDSILYSEGYAIALIFMALPSLPVTALTAMQAKKEIYIYNVVNPIFGIAVMVIFTAKYGIWGLIIAKGISGLINYLLSLYLVYCVKPKNV